MRNKELLSEYRANPMAPSKGTTPAFSVLVSGARNRHGRQAFLTVTVLLLKIVSLFAPPSDLHSELLCPGASAEGTEDLDSVLQPSDFPLLGGRSDGSSSLGCLLPAVMGCEPWCWMRCSGRPRPCEGVPCRCLFRPGWRRLPAASVGSRWLLAHQALWGWLCAAL